MPVDPLAERFRISLDLAETGLALMRQNLRRQDPEATEAEIDHLLQVWLERRPLDCPGRLVQHSHA